MIDERAEYLLGQMMFAIGAGANGVHIRRTAVRKFRERYEPSTYAFVSKPNWNTIWEENSIYTLRYFQVIGRLAAQHATTDGTHSIGPEHLERARVFVEATYYQDIRHLPPSPAARGANRGDICPPEVRIPMPDNG